MAKAEGKLEKDREDDRSKEQLGLRGIGTRQSPFAPFNSLYLSMLSLRPRGGSATATSTSGGAVPPGHSRELGTGWASAPSRKKMPGADACLPALGPRNEVGGISRVVPGRRRGRPSSLDFAAACGLVDYGSVHVAGGPTANGCCILTSEATRPNPPFLRPRPRTARRVGGRNAARTAFRCRSSPRPCR